MSSFQDGWNRARNEFARNQRLRFGVLVMAAILAFYSFLVLRDWRAGLHDQYVERRQYLRKLKSLAGQNQWPVRAEQMSRVRKALEAEIPAFASQGLAQASAQTWARDLAAVHGSAVQVQSQPSQPVDGQPELWRVPVVLTGSLPPRAVVNLIQQIEKRGSLSVVEQALILNRENQTFQLTVVSFVRVAGRGVDAAR